MKKLLRIDCSARTSGSHSRSMADYFEKNWKLANPTGKVIYRDLSKFQVPHIQNETIEAAYTPAEQLTAAGKQALAISDELVGEIKMVDELLISSPLYNYNIPSNLKAYFDHIIRVGHTFGINENGYYGLLTKHGSYLITAKGESYKGTEMEKLDFQEPYIQVILRFLGIENKGVFSLEGTGHADLLERNVPKIQNEIDQALLKVAV